MNKNILVTGSKGFIGSALVRKLSQEFPGYTIFEFDLHNGNIAETKLDFYQIDHVFHLAGKTFVPDSWKYPHEFYKTNVLGTSNILEFCKEKKSSITYISAYVYGEPELIPIPEQHPLKPNNPYMHSKVIAESLCEFYASFYQVRTTIFRPFNIYGHNQNPKFLIPYIIGQVINNDRDHITVKNLEPKRDFLFLDDLIEALILSMKQNKILNIYNVGSGTSDSVKEIIDILQNIAQTNKKVRSENEVRKNEILDLKADITKIERELGWKPKTIFRDGLKSILESILKNEV